MWRSGGMATYAGPDALGIIHISFLTELLEIGIVVALCGVFFGSLLDYGITQNPSDVIFTQ